MSSPAQRLAQDQPQANESTRSESGRLAQDSSQFSEGDRIDEIRRLKEEEKKSKEREEALEKAEKLAKAKESAIWYKIPNRPTGTQYKTVAGGKKIKVSNSAALAQWKRKWQSKIEHNRRMTEMFGKKFSFAPNVGGLERTSSDILLGKSGVPLKQVSASVAKQVRLVNLRRAWEDGRITWGRLQSELGSVGEKYKIKKALEAERRRGTSIKQAKAKAIRGVQQNFVAGSKFSTVKTTSKVITNAPKNTRIINTTTGQGTLQDLKVSRQPDQSKVSPLLKQNMKSNKLANHGGSFIGYSPNGAPYQGPAQPKYEVTTPDGETRTFSSKMKAEEFLSRIEDNYKSSNSNQQLDINKNSFLNFLSFPEKENGFTPTGDKISESVLGLIDSGARKIEATDKYYRENKPNSPESFVTGFVNSIWSQGTSLINLVGDADEYLKKEVFKLPTNERKQLFVSKDVVGDYLGGTVSDVILADPLKGSGYKSAAKTASEQPLVTTMAQVSGAIVPVVLTGGLGALKKLVGVGGEKVFLQTTAKTVTGTPVKDAVKISTEYKLFGKPVVTKTLKQPTVVKTTEFIPIKQKLTSKIKNIKPEPQVKIRPASNSGTFSFGSTNPKTVLQRAEVDPQGRGFELMTGTKTQTQFNKSIIGELAKQGKASADDVEKLKIVTEGVKLATKAPVKTSKTTTQLNELTQQQSRAVFSAINVLQSPKNWFRGQRRVGQVGGSFSQQSQLRAAHRKEIIHDLDIDVRSTKIAERGAKTVFEKVKPLETNEIKFSLGGKKVKVTTRKQDADEFTEFLDPKDQLKYNTEALQSGLRFGQKYRSDTLSQYTKRPIKDPVTGVKIRSINDQTLAKAASVVSLQGKNTEKFTGTPKPEHAVWVARQNKSIESGKLSVNPPTLRAKDTVDLYHIFKSRSEDLIDVGKKTEGKRLDEIAEKFKGLNKGIDFDAKTVGKVTFDDTPSATSLISASAKQYKPIIGIPVEKVVTPKNPTESNPNQLQNTLINSVIKKNASIRITNSKTITAPRTIVPTSILGSSSSSLSQSKNVLTRPVSIQSKTSSSNSQRNNSPTSRRITKSPSSVKGSGTSKKIIPLSVKSPTTKSGKSPSVRGGSGGSGGLGSLGSAGGLNGKSLSVHSIRKRPVLLIDNKNTTKKKKDKVKDPHDFLGNTKLNDIEGLFKRETVIHGDRHTIKQIKKDKKRGFKPLKVKIF